jgi:hypothetical protein
MAFFSSASCLWACLGFSLYKGPVVSIVPLDYNCSIFSEDVSIFEVADEGIGLELARIMVDHVGDHHHH